VLNFFRLLVQKRLQKCYFKICDLTQNYYVIREEGGGLCFKKKTRRINSLPTNPTWNVTMSPTFFSLLVGDRKSPWIVPLKGISWVVVMNWAREGCRRQRSSRFERNVGDTFVGKWREFGYMVIYHHLWPTLVFFHAIPVARSKSIHLSRPRPVKESLEKRWGDVVGSGPGNVRPDTSYLANPPIRNSTHPRRSWTRGLGESGARIEDFPGLSPYHPGISTPGASIYIQYCEMRPKPQKGDMHSYFPKQNYGMCVSQTVLDNTKWCNYSRHQTSL